MAVMALADGGDGHGGLRTAAGRRKAQGKKQVEMSVCEWNTCTDPEKGGRERERVKKPKPKNEGKESSGRIVILALFLSR